MNSPRKPIQLAALIFHLKGHSGAEVTLLNYALSFAAFSVEDGRGDYCEWILLSICLSGSEDEQQHRLSKRQIGDELMMAAVAAGIAVEIGPSWRTVEKSDLAA